LVPGRYTVWIAAKDSSGQIGPRSESVFQMLAGPIASLGILSDYTALKVGDQTTFTVAGTDTIGNTVMMKSEEIEWSVLVGIGTIDQNGLFTATTAGDGGIQVKLKADNAVGDSRNLSVFDSPAPIEVGGTISEHTRWTTINSPVTITQSLIVAEGVILTIEPGVEVRFNSGYGLTVHGQLVARGTAQHPIAFMAASGKNPGSWGSISFSGSSVDAILDTDGNYIDGCLLQHCLIESGAQGANGQVVIDSALPLIDHCTIINGSTRGIFVNNAKPNLIIRHCTISNNGNMGVNINESNVTLWGNVISKNTNGGLNATSSTLTLNNNIVADNIDGSGIKVSGGIKVSAGT
ncbi:MAG: right-handed parallel beta-helix repeat-containing protein, partial [Gammaproteobacteria bacterium]|nr:right-handed parallel beta-helix repeat-containing protein [Gammaproteobacteria bacterium]